MPCCPKTALYLVVAGVVTVDVVLAPTPASASVSLVPDTIAEGGTRSVAVRVVNEDANAVTTRFELHFPRHPALLVDATPVPGWTVTRRDRRADRPVRVDDRETSVVTDIITYSGGRVRPDGYQDFPLTMAPLPENTSLVFTATQTFSDGRVLRWTGATTGAPTITIGDPTPESPGPQSPAAPELAAGPMPPSTTKSAEAVASAVPPPAQASPAPDPRAVATAPSTTERLLLGEPAVPQTDSPSSRWEALGLGAALAVAVLAAIGSLALRARRRESGDPDGFFAVFDDEPAPVLDHDGRADRAAVSEVTSR
ncbi:DUF1775 domain-containing protein [Saccharopolyspora mangrovi]|uniref:DUF1775 domain-containing protein n=1 Tax=Saccharopolyspora mangrovi TaxID=3082379 RepID=A0ABU6AEY7_9PSEU|nr:DUF1775 domain-containing protein [Saccharopolyspora sp. S2-29]MEB3370105.1 DUF1775 domain-containing protein [Saccharopolyspora sp. S2-29]